MTLGEFQTQSVFTDSDLCQILESILGQSSSPSAKVESIREVLDQI